MPAVSDSFDNADSTTVGSWLLDTGDWEIVSNKRERNPRPCVWCGKPKSKHPNLHTGHARYQPFQRTEPLRAHTRVIRELESEIASLMEENERLDVIVTLRANRDLRWKIRLRAMMDMLGTFAFVGAIGVIVWLIYLAVERFG